MEQYMNRGQDSNIHAYEMGTDYIDVKFSDGAVYRYTYGSASAHHIETMKNLARSGQGLNSYINKNVKNKYERKL